MTPAQKARETRQRHQAIWKAKEAELQAERTATYRTLTAVRDNPDASPETRLEAIRMIREMRENRYII